MAESGSIPSGYEKPVEAIEAFFKDKPFRLIRDKKDARSGTDLKRFMDQAGKCPHVIVVHSDKYWKSPYCLFELWTADNELPLRRGRTDLPLLFSVVIPVEHLRSNIRTHEGLEEYLRYWESFIGTPRMLGESPQTWKLRFRALLDKFSTYLDKERDFNIVWENDGKQALTGILARLESPAVTPEA